MAIHPEPDTTLSQDIKRMKLGHQALPSLKTLQGQVLEEARTELTFPESMNTFNKMLLDTNVASGVNVFKMMIGRIPWEIKAPDKSSDEEKKRAEQLNLNLHLLERPWEEYINEILTYIEYGFSPLEKVYVKNLDLGDDVLKVGWKHFPTISQDSIKKWYFDDKTGVLRGLRQDISGMRDRNYKTNTLTKKDIEKQKFLLFRHDPKRDNPEGNSPLKQCYIKWKYLSIIEEFEVIGVTKDLGGVAVFRIPQEILNKAAEDTSSWEATFISDLEKNAAAITAGDQSFLIIPEVYNDLGKPMFDFKLQGVEGGGKNYETNAIATRHANSILLSFFASALKLGSDGVGSNALFDGQSNLITLGVEAILKNIQRTLNHDLIKQTYQLNGWKYNPLSAARFEYGQIEEDDLNLISSFIQRTMAVGAWRPTSDLEDKLRNYVGLAPMSEANPEILETKDTSRSGDGMSSGLGDGTGDSTSSGGDRSTSNKENK